MDQVTFGLFDWIDRGEAPLHQLYEERLQLLEVADAAGFSATTWRSTMPPRLAWRPHQHCSSPQRRSVPSISAWGH